MAHWNSFHWDDGSRYDEAGTTTNNIIRRTHMYDLHKVLTNPFDDPGIGVNGLVAFTTDNISKMTGNNPGGIFTGRITATNTALTGVNTAFSADLGSLGARKTSKKAKDDYRKTLTDGAGKIMVTLQNKYGRKSAMLETFFPQGLSKFNKATDDQVTNEWTTLITALTAHSADVGAQTVTDATALKTGWVAVYAPSESSSGAKDTTMTAKNAARAALQLELFKNLLTIALQYPRQPEMLDQFMQQSLLQPHTQSPGASPTPPSPAPPGP
jgi:hypothetical protein